MVKKFTTRFWIGLSQLLFSTGFSWSDGSPVSFTNWNVGEPNNLNNNEYCVDMAWNNGFLLNFLS